MRRLAVISLAVLAAAVFSAASETNEGPVYDESKRIHCRYDLFPDTKNFVVGQLNQTITHLEGPYFDIRGKISAALDPVVTAQADACIKIGELIDKVDKANAVSTVPAVPTDVNECTSGSHDCDSNADCSNTDGTFTCTCKSGFTGNGKTCTEGDCMLKDMYQWVNPHIKTKTDSAEACRRICLAAAVGDCTGWSWNHSTNSCFYGTAATKNGPYGGISVLHGYSTGYNPCVE